MHADWALSAGPACGGEGSWAGGALRDAQQAQLLPQSGPCGSALGKG